MEKSFKFHNDNEASVLLGKHDENIKLIGNELSVKIVARGENLCITGQEDNVNRVSDLINELFIIIRNGAFLRKGDISYAIKCIKENRALEFSNIYLDRIEVASKKRFVTPKTPCQKAYVDAIRDYDIVFGIGPAGTGKTYLAMAMAVSSLKKQEVSRIILTRPAVEAGEKLGFLPGDIEDKVSPYLRPLYDALYDMMEVDMINRYLETGAIEIAPLAYMRGRTLNSSFIVLDEAQNTTPEQMKMFLTRLGFDSKTVITGDITQVDLPQGRVSGLIQVQSILNDIEGIKFIYFSGHDVVRHELVQEIIKAYETHNH
jgi:phosphate starvation-inducible PhoH-like protein